MQVIILADKDAPEAVEQSLVRALEVTATPVVVCPLDLYTSLQRYTPAGVRPIRVPLRYAQKGAAMSLLAATGVVKDADAVIVMDCSARLGLGALARFAEFSNTCFKAEAQSTMLCFTAKDGDDAHSFVTLRDNVVQQVVDGGRVSDVASSGVHAFQTWEVAKRAVYEMVILGTMTDGLYNLAPAHNNLQFTTAMVL